MLSSVSGKKLLHIMPYIVLCFFLAQLLGKAINITSSIGTKTKNGSFYSNTLALTAQKRNNDFVKRTLLVISGELRSFLHLWNWTYASLVEPNEPCDVILSIHGKKADKPDVILKDFRHHIVAILTTESEIPVGRIEFWLILRALKIIEPIRYTYVIKTRFDLFHRVPIALKTVYGEDDNFIHTFRMFHKALLETTARTNFGVAETLFAWIMTAGLVELIPTMIMRTPVTVYAKLAPNDWNKNIRAALHNFSKLYKPVMDEGNAENDKKILRILHLTLQRYKIVYNIGSTWVQFGRAEHMIPASIKIAKEYGQHTWADVGFNDSDILNNNQWRHVTESQMRLTFLKGGYNLIDIIHQPDIEQSFRMNQTFKQAKDNKSLLFFIVRNEQQYRNIHKLGSHTNITYW